ncbi:hypothetical protein ILUMI_01939 [Ignelater luminosus]|uniref:Transposase n=1 Tax=Ignelater luminosus TaxID=2038154 RepID=A0A8K0GNQ0_IGNLU|nr:hypothetical protein ILUMI_01939 [Ignelater luminosus]
MLKTICEVKSRIEDRENSKQNEDAECFNMIVECTEKPMLQLFTKIQLANERFVWYAPVEQAVSISESECFGRYGFRVHPWQTYQIRQIKTRAWQKESSPIRGLGECVVFGFFNILNSEFSDRKCLLSFDNFFTSARLVTELEKLGYGAIGKVRENRTEYKKNIRGDFNLVAIRYKNNIYVAQKGIRNVNITVEEIKVVLGIMLFSEYHSLLSKRMYWKVEPDCQYNAVVTVVTNCIPLEPMKTAVRYSGKMKIDVRMPGSVASYNQHMGGIDLNDQFVLTYRCSIRSKKNGSGSFVVRQ